MRYGGRISQLDRFKDCLAQLIFGRQLRFAVEQPVHFAQLNSKLFPLDEYVLIFSVFDLPNLPIETY